MPGDDKPDHASVIRVAHFQPLPGKRDELVTRIMPTIETMRTVEDRAKNGLSILMAPEGTRLDTTEVGPFKKGPFRLAMAAGIPIVPIVIRNAEFVAARNSATINPGTVDVAVFPPISLQDWAVDTLPEHIAEVRQLYLDTLANWPVDELPQVDLYAEKKAARKARAKPASKTTGTKVAAKKAAPKKAGPKKAASKSAVKKQPAQPNPNASEVALNNGEAPQPGPDQPGNTESTPRPEGHT